MLGKRHRKGGGAKGRTCRIMTNSRAQLKVTDTENTAATRGDLRKRCLAKVVGRNLGERAEYGKEKA